ncbi:MAG: hypothetical protein ACFE8A_02995 [Candidatus Hodarchaeota archaeon]
MDISKFNQELSIKVAKARSYEKQNDMKNAVQLWIEISEMTIAASKTAGLDFSYRNMLITKTQQILDHIKELKSPRKEEIIIENIKNKEEISIEQKPLEIEKTEPLILDETEKINQPLKNSEKVASKGLDGDNWVEKLKFDSKAKGILEISAPKDFKIITPHDPNYVDKMKELSEKLDTRVPNNHENQEKKDENAEIGRDHVICFACGAKLARNTKICSYCGTELK